MAHRCAVLFFLAGPLFVRAFREVVFLSIHSNTGLAYSLDYIGPAIDIAFLEVNQQYAPNYRFSLVTFNSTNSKTCADVEKDTLPFASKLLWTSKKKGSFWAILASGCSGAVTLLADLGRERKPTVRSDAFNEILTPEYLYNLDLESEWSLPVITCAGTDTLLDSRTRFPTLLRLLSYQQLPETIFVAQVCNYFRWTDIVVICDDSAVESNFYALICKTLTSSLSRVAGNRNVYSFNYNFKKEPQYQRILTEASSVSRVFIVVTHASRLKILLAKAADLGMAEGEYAFMTFEPFLSSSFGTLDWKPDPLVGKAFEFLLVISTVFSETRKLDVLLDAEIKERSAQVYGKVYASDEKVSPFVHSYYDGVHLLAQIITENWDNITQFKDNAWIAKSAWMRTFHTQQGRSFTLNNNGDTDTNYVVRAFDYKSNTFVAMMVWNRTEAGFHVTSGFSGMHWPMNHSPPANRPQCGYSGVDSTCSNRRDDISKIIGLALGVLLIFALTVFMGFTVYDKSKSLKKIASNIMLNLSALRRFCYQIYISLYKLNNSIEWMISSAELQSVAQEMVVRTNTGPRLSIARVTANINQSRIRMYRGNCVWIRSSANDSVFRLDNPTILAVNLRQSLALNSSNISTLIGLSIQTHPVIAISEYFQKGSLYQLLSTNTAWIDSSLQYSLLCDILKGLMEIHESAIGVHRWLKSHNCMITHQLSIKLVDFGLPFMIRTNTAPDIREQNFEKLIWTAPENLRNPQNDLTRESDLYSFGIVAHEILFLTRPYQLPGSRSSQRSLNPVEAKELITVIIADDCGTVRPPIPVNGLANNIQALLARCWHADPHIRPEVSEVLATIETYTGIGREFSYIDIVLSRLEKYAADLEAKVHEQTEYLTQEKRRVEALLQEILPKTVAMGLMSGVVVPPELFESATVAFSGVWEFGTMVISRTPLEMIHLLNDLYCKVDGLLEKYDVYKVETISDSYMFSSGVPLRNGNQHVLQVALLCCDIQRVIQHSPVGGINIEIQIGLHTGALAAGVVGQRMPRYCLFGDTVNIASRMMTSCDPQKVQISRPAKELLELESPKNLSICKRGEVSIKGKGIMETFWITWTQTPGSFSSSSQDQSVRSDEL